MSASTLPLHVEPFKWADRGAEVDVTVPLKSFTRLLGGALSVEGVVTVRCDFARDAQGRAWLSGTAAATVSLTCQRCLEAVQVELDADFRLALVGDEAEAEALPEEDDYLVVGDDSLVLQEVVEDELILALPLAPTHDDCELAYVSDAAESASEEKRENPFQVLAAIKAQDQDK